MGKELSIGIMHVGPIATNCYLISRESGSESCVLVDPGGSSGQILKVLSEKKMIPEAILLTHAHDDHTMAVGELCRAYPGVKVYIAENERRMVEDRSFNCGFFGEVEMLHPDVWVKDGDVLELIGSRFEVICTPGHTEGSCCYYLKDESVLLAGDTLFRGSYGRVDLPTGSSEEMELSLRKLFEMLPGNTNVLPGHGMATTIAYEKIVEGYED